MQVLASATRPVEPAAWWGPGCLVLVAVSTLFAQFRPQAGAVWACGIAAALFLVIERRRIPPSIARVSVIVGLASVATMPFSHALVPSLAKGIGIGGLMVSLISAVSLLARAALNSPHSRVVAQHLLATGPRSRYLWFSMASQLFGGLLGMAGVNLLLQMASSDDAGAEDDRLSVFASINRSFAAATLWSPMVSNLTILIALYPGLSWFAVVPLTLGLAAGGIVVGTVLDLWRLRGREPAVRPGRPAQPLVGALVPLLLAMSGFLGIVMLVAARLHIAVAGAIVLVVPVVVLALHAAQAKGKRRVAQSVAMIRADVLDLPRLAGEVALFMAAGCGGTVIASAIPPSWTAAVGGLLAHSPVLGCLTLMLAIVALGFAAVHPVLSTVLVASSLPPALLHLPPLEHLAAVLVGWAVASCATPFSMMALMTSRYSGYSIYAVTVRANHVFGLLCIAIAALALGLASTLVAGGA